MPVQSRPQSRDSNEEQPRRWKPGKVILSGLGRELAVLHAMDSIILACASDGHKIG